VRKNLIAILCLCLSHGSALAQAQVEPVYSIWDVTLGQPVEQMPDSEVGEITCGTNGGPSGAKLESFGDFLACQPEGSGLHEISFSYDDEQDYIARALENEYRALRGGTSVFAHPVIVSVLVDANGIVQGRRIVTDDRIGDYERRTAYTLIRNFKARYGNWSLACADVEMKEGEKPVGNQFIHEYCTGRSPDGKVLIAVESSYLRKKGQLGINRETQKVNTGYFESQTRFEEILTPFTVGTAP